MNNLEVIKFNLSGTGAVFKQPYMNETNLTYSQIHKVALLGMLGAIIGLKGHRSRKDEIEEVSKYLKEVNDKIKKAEKEINAYEAENLKKMIKRNDLVLSIKTINESLRKEISKTQDEKKIKRISKIQELIKNIDIQELLKIELILKYPEFYRELSKLKIGIVPGNKNFLKNIQTYVNSTGFANSSPLSDKEISMCGYEKLTKEERKERKEKGISADTKPKSGQSLIYKEESLRDPSWDIYIMKGTASDEIYLKLKDFILNRKSIYSIFLGKNQYPAEIKNMKIMNVSRCREISTIESIFPYNLTTYFGDVGFFSEPSYQNWETLPIGMKPCKNNYIEEKLTWTNKRLGKIPFEKKINNIFRDEESDKTIYFM